jgi:hypothetical protein
MNTVLDILRRILDALVDNPIKSLGFGGIILSAVLRGCLGDAHGPSTRPPRDEPRGPQEQRTHLTIDKEAFAELIKQYFDECRSASKSGSYCGRPVPSPEELKDSSNRQPFSGPNVSSDFDRDSLIAMYRADIILQSPPNKWEYLKIKHYLPEIDNFVSKYESRLDELKRLFGGQVSPHIKWAFAVMPSYQEGYRPGLEAKIRRMQ